ncbi:hypothetical protein NDU88_008430 [Pleurodeles waltl]|uniref:Endonuclease/exonuclease/phosphatase domain-containing protein n=1 Tax=Pleurodeles waltl TaxID=8319 RepID=A0AAV7RT59_PLEWA|nr:hypothetical protein NDU88_008430 [Pleurodeles waltl]
MGLGDPRKRRHILAYLERHRIHIALLQETHFTPGRRVTFADRWSSYSQHATYSSYSRGTSTLIRRNPEIIWGRVLQYFVTIVNCYAPNADEPSFFDSIWSCVAEIGLKYLAWGGDFNLALDRREVRKTEAMPLHHRAAERLRAGIIAQDMVDGLELQLKRLESEREEAPSADIARRLLATLTDFQEPAEREVLFRGKYAWARSYGEGERPETYCSRAPVTAPSLFLSRRLSFSSLEAVPRSHSNLGTLRDASEDCFRVRGLHEKTDYAKRGENATEKNTCGAPETEKTKTDGSKASSGTDRTGAVTTSGEETRTRETRHDPWGS